MGTCTVSSRLDFSLLVSIPLRHPVPLSSASDTPSQLLPPAEMGSSPQPFPFGAVWVPCLSYTSPSARGTKLSLAGLSRCHAAAGTGWGEEVPRHRWPVLLGAHGAGLGRGPRGASPVTGVALSHRPLPHAVGVLDRPPDAEHLPPALEGAGGCHQGHGHRDPVRQRQVGR